MTDGPQNLTKAAGGNHFYLVRRRSEPSSLKVTADGGEANTPAAMALLTLISLARSRELRAVLICAIISFGLKGCSLPTTFLPYAASPSLIR